VGEAVAEVGSTANNYKVLARLATGGMAEIFLARGVSGTGVERYCVLKRILRNRASDESFVRMFLDEARLAAQLQHPNIAQVYDIGKLGDSYFFTMEYVHGETVRAIMQRARSLRRDLPLASLLTIVAGAASGLHHAHDRIGVDGRALNIVHRDVSPSNLMVSYEGNTKVVDFGVAKASDRAIETCSGTVKGKISYLSPEQARGSSSIDRRSDLFSLGIVMWEMLTTERLYKRASDFENMTAIVTEPTPPPSSRKPHIPPELDAITLKLLAKSPADRFQTADQLVDALEDFASRNQAMISPSALSRFLREMFGQRPEPWVELDTIEAEGDVPLTVTGEPIPAVLAIPIDADIDLRLDRVPAFEQLVPQVDDALPTPFIGRPEDQPTLPHPAVSVPTQRGPAVAHQTLYGIGTASGPQLRIPSSGPQSYVPQSGPQEISASGLAYPRAATGDRLVDEPEPRKSGVGWQLVSVIMIAAIVGSLTMWMVMRDRGGTTHAVDAPAAAAVVVAPPPIDAAEVVAVVEVDAAPVVEPPPAVDAAPEPVADTPPPKKPEVKRPPEPKKTPIEAAWDASNFRGVISLCQKAFPGAGDDVRCVVAACKVHMGSRARTYFTKLSPTSKARKGAIITACWNADTEIDLETKSRPKEEKPSCETDPMSCQH
jgi:serine/threonine protein kinase